MCAYKYLYAKLFFTWHRSDVSKPTVECGIEPDDPYKEDMQVQIHKAIGAAQVHFLKSYEEAPLMRDLSAVVAN